MDDDKDNNNDHLTTLSDESDAFYLDHCLLKVKTATVSQRFLKR